MGRLDGRVALITGAASGIGAACALRFAREGACIAGFDVAKPGRAHWSQVAKGAPDVGFWEVDVRDEDAVTAAVAAAAERFGRLDALVNCAGVSGIGTVGDLAVEEWDRVLDVNLKGTFLVSKHVIGHMVARSAGSIVNLASVEGLEGFGNQAAYNASKGGVILLTRNMAIDYGHLGIRVNCLCPGFIETPLTAMLQTEELKEICDAFVKLHMLGRPGKPEEVAAAALFLVSDEASFVTGASLAVDGGFSAGRRLTEPAPGESQPA